jgi:hypothetical protein
MVLELMWLSVIYSSHLNFCLCCRSIRNPHDYCIYQIAGMDAALAKNPITVSILILAFNISPDKKSMQVILVL